MKKWVITIVTAVLLVVMYAVIFGFSEQNAEESSGLSYKVSKTAVNAADKLAQKHWSEKQKDEMAENTEIAEGGTYAFVPKSADNAFNEECPIMCTGQKAQ